MDKQFLDIIFLIKEARNNAFKAVNTELINLYWNIGKYISYKLNNSSWGDKTVDELAFFIKKNNPELKGFNRRGLYRMKQFYETYADSEIMSPMVTQISKSDSIVSTVSAQAQIINNEGNIIVSAVSAQFKKEDIKKSVLCTISWTHHKIIFSRCNSVEEMFFYVHLSKKENYSSRELERQINVSTFERKMLNKHSKSLTSNKISKEINLSFKDSYIFEFLNLPEPHNESDLQKGLIHQMKNFILELGKEFLFVGEEYKLQVGNSDFYIDLLFYHRKLQCLIVFELKNDKFKPEHLGQLNFYLEALDRDVKNSNENPSIGILLCKDKDIEVVEYALSRSLSPTLISKYQTQLPNKKILQEKLHQLFLENE